jgi:hypothetical protein
MRWTGVVVDVYDGKPVLGAAIPVLSLQLNNDTAQPPQTRLCTRLYAPVLDVSAYLLGIPNEADSLAQTGVLRVWRGVAAASHAHPYFTLDDWTCKKSTRIFWTAIFSRRRYVLIL